jgi:hypothetical protein
MAAAASCVDQSLPERLAGMHAMSSEVQPNGVGNGTPRDVAGTISGIVLGFDLLAMLLLALAIGTTRDRIARLFAEFGLSLPGYVAALMHVPMTAIQLGFMLLAVGLCLLEFGTSRGLLRLRVHVAVALALILLWCVYVWSVFVPLLQLVEQLQWR